MTREQYEAMRARLAEISYYEPAVIDEIAEQALEGVEGLLARVDALEAENAALRARAVPEVVWPEGRVYVDVGELRLVARPDGEWWVEITTENDTEEMVSGHETSLELAQSACRSAFLRLVGVKS